MIHASYLLVFQNIWSVSFYLYALFLFSIWMFDNNIELKYSYFMYVNIRFITRLMSYKKKSHLIYNSFFSFFLCLQGSFLFTIHFVPIPKWVLYELCWPFMFLACNICQGTREIPNALADRCRGSGAKNRERNGERRKK